MNWHTDLAYSRETDGQFDIWKRRNPILNDERNYTRDINSENYPPKIAWLEVRSL